MSTKSTRRLVDTEKLSIHIYNEMHDGLIHMEIGDNKSNSSINICLPRHIADELIKVLEPLDK